MVVDRYGWSPDSFVLKRGVPVRWVIDGKEINGCNNAIVVPKLGLDFRIERGTQVIEFTPQESGNIPWSCWMGMIPGIFIVEDDIDMSDEAQVQAAQAQLAQARADYDRAQRLKKADAISQSAFDQARTAYNVASSNLGSVTAQRGVGNRLSVCPTLTSYVPPRSSRRTSPSSHRASPSGQSSPTLPCPTAR